MEKHKESFNFPIAAGVSSHGEPLTTALVFSESHFHRVGRGHEKAPTELLRRGLWSMVSIAFRDEFQNCFLDDGLWGPCPLFP